MKWHYDVLVVGGGASGMAAAIAAARRGKKTLLLERCDRLGRKVLASGNGRCNLMNTGVPRYYGEVEFARRVLKNCPPSVIRLFFRELGLMLTETPEGLVYPLTMMASSVFSALQQGLHLSGAELMTGSTVTHCFPERTRFRVDTLQGEHYVTDELILTCGGMAQPKLGGTPRGYDLLRVLGHHVVSPFPALTPLETDAKSISGLSGIRVHCGVSLLAGELLLHREEGEVLFTDYGVSGICVMQCARFTQGEQTHLELDLLSRAFDSREKALQELKERRERFASLSPVSLLEGILCARLAYAVLKQAGLALRGETAGTVSDRDLEVILDTASRYRLEVTGTRGIDYAQVTAGGGLCSEFDPDTMESRLHPGLRAAGELLNVDGDCGGFNLMFAFASGLLAGGYPEGKRAGATGEELVHEEG